MSKARQSSTSWLLRVVRVDEGVGVVVVMTVMMMMTVEMMTTTVMITLRSNRGGCKNRKAFTSWLAAQSGEG